MVSLLAQASYNLIHMIFSKPLNFHVAASSREREDRLISQLGQVREPDFLCSLNQLFNVHFAMSARYKALSVEQKRKVLSKFLLKLLKRCFRELWVVIIDDAQYADNESMLLFRTMTKRNMIFFILSIGHKLSGEYEVHPAILERARVCISIKKSKNIIPRNIISIFLIVFMWILFFIIFFSLNLYIVESLIYI